MRVQNDPDIIKAINGEGQMMSERISHHKKTSLAIGLACLVGVSAYGAGAPISTGFPVASEVAARVPASIAGAVKAPSLVRLGALKPGDLSAATLQPLVNSPGVPRVSKVFPAPAAAAQAPGPIGALKTGHLSAIALQPLADSPEVPGISVQSPDDSPRISASGDVGKKLAVAAARISVDAARTIEALFPAKPAVDLPVAASPLPAAAKGGYSTLAENLVSGLLQYHRLDGRNDGSGLSGVQYPPLAGVPQGDDGALKQSISRMASFLASQPGIEYKPAPTDPPGRAIFRRQLAQQAADDIRQHAAEEMNALVARLPEGPMKLFVQKALLKAQPEFWRAPSSSSGKYHPADEINYGGLLVHSIRVTLVGIMLSDYFGFQRPDRVMAALLIHDIQKGGIPWKHTSQPGDAPDSGYVADHGPVAAEWLKGFKDECGPDCDAIIDDVGAHMAQWNKPQPAPPQTLEEQIVSYADYLAAQDEVYVRWRNS